MASETNACRCRKIQKQHRRDTTAFVLVDPIPFYPLSANHMRNTTWSTVMGTVRFLKEGRVFFCAEKTLEAFKFNLFPYHPHSFVVLGISFFADKTFGVWQPVKFTKATNDSPFTFHKISLFWGRTPILFNLLDNRWWSVEPVLGSVHFEHYLTAIGLKILWSYLCVRRRKISKWFTVTFKWQNIVVLWIQI